MVSLLSCTKIGGLTSLKPNTNTPPINEVFQFAFISDPQKLASDNPTAYNNLIQYMVDQKDIRNLKMFINIGDTVDTGDNTTQWARATTAHAPLDGSLPFLVCIGNHDYDDDSGTTSRDATGFDTLFPPSRFSGQSWYLGNYPANQARSTAAKITVGKYTYLFLNLEYIPEDDMMTWAQGIVDANTDADYIIIATHNYIFPGSGNYGTHPLVTGPASITRINNFIDANPKVKLVICGHLSGGSGRRVDNDVEKHVVDYQEDSGSNWGASAVARFYEINQSDHSVTATTYNPITNTNYTDSDEQFTFTL